MHFLPAQWTEGIVNLKHKIVKERKPRKSDRRKSWSMNSTVSIPDISSTGQTLASFAPRSAAQKKPPLDTTHSLTPLPGVHFKMGVNGTAGEAEEEPVNRSQGGNREPILPIDSLEGVAEEPVDRVVNSQNVLAGLLGNKEDWDKLHFLRTKASTLRSAVQKQRRTLREKQVATDLANEAFMKHARENRPLHPTPSIEEGQINLEKLYRELQDTRNEYGPSLEEYTQDEDALDEVEFEMERIEGHIYSLVFGRDSESRNPDSELSPGTRVGALFPSPSPFLGLVAGVQDRFQPVQVKYLSRLGDLDLAREKYQNLVQERDGLLAEQDTLSRIGLELRDDLEAILKEIPSQEAQLQEEIANIEADVERLRLDCVQEGVILEGSDNGSGYSQSLYEGDVHHFVESGPGEPTGSQVRVISADAG